MLRGFNPFIAAVAVFALFVFCRPTDVPGPVPVEAGDSLLGAVVVEGRLTRRALDRARLSDVRSAPLRINAELRWTRSSREVSAFGRVSCGRPGDRLRVLARWWVPPEPAFRGAPPAPAPHLRIVRSGPCLVLGTRHPANAAAMLQGARDTLATQMREKSEGADPTGVALLLALGLGVRSEVPPHVRRAFARAGVAHLLAVSGLHLSVVVGGAFVALRWLLLLLGIGTVRFGADRLAATCCFPLAFIHAELAGGSPSARRAAVMLGVILAGRWARRTTAPLTALAVAFAVLVAAEPGIEQSLSFQLSFAATAALLLWGERRLRNSPRGFSLTRLAGAALEASIIASAATVPLLAHHFGRFPVVGLLTNAWATPMGAMVVVPMALGDVVLAGHGASWSVMVHELLAAATGAFAEAVVWASRIPGASVSVRAYSAISLALHGLAMVIATVARGRTRAAGAVLVGALLIYHVAWTPPPPSSLAIDFLPVGQGDAALLRTPDGVVVLIDTGPAASVDRVLLPYLRMRGVVRIDHVFITHAHADHDGGLSRLLDVHEVGTVWHNGEAPFVSPELRAKLAQAHEGPVLEFSEGHIEVIGNAQSGTTINDRSLVLRVVYQDRRLLFVGDVELQREAQLLACCASSLQAEILKVAHHGSASSSGLEFLAVARPQHAIISVGRGNRFGHPRAEVVNRLSSVAEVYRTDQDGSISLRVDRRAIVIQRFRSRLPP